MKYNKIRKSIHKYQAGGAIGTLAEVIGGFIPGVSEFLDLVGIARGIMTGNPVDVALSAAGLFTPVVGGPALKAGKNAASDILKAGKKLQKHASEIEDIAKLVAKEMRTPEEALELLKLRTKVGVEPVKGAKIGGDEFKRLGIDARNKADIQQGFVLNERGVAVNDMGKPALTDPNFRGYDAEQIREQLHRTILDPNGKYISLRRLAQNNGQARHFLKSAEELDTAIRQGELHRLPRFNVGFGRTPQVEHVVAAFGDRPDRIFGSGWHADRPYNPNVDVRNSGSGNMNFFGDTDLSVLGYHKMDPTDITKVISELKGIEKERAQQALEFTELFDKIYLSKKGNLSDKLPAIAYKDPQIQEYLDARKTLSLVLGHNPTKGRIVPVVYEAPSALETVRVNGRGIGMFDDLSGLSSSDFLLAGRPYHEGVQFTDLGTVGARAGVSLDNTIQADIRKGMKISAMRLDDLGNRPLMQTVGKRGGFTAGFKHGGQI